MKNRKIIALTAVTAAILMAFTAAMPIIAEAPAEEPVAYEPIAAEPAVEPGVMPPPPTEDYILISGEVDDSDAGAAKAILLAKKYFGGPTTIKQSTPGRTSTAILKFTRSTGETAMTVPA